MIDYVHIVSYWEGNNRLSNLKKHLEFVKNELNNVKSKLLIFVIRCNDLNNIKIKNELNIIKNKMEMEIVILYRYNSGGTVKSLEDGYKYLKENGIDFKYISCSEDDYCFIDNKFLEKANKYLNKGNIFVGSLWPESYHKITEDGIKFGENCVSFDRRICPHIKIKHIKKTENDKEKYINDSLYRWCEDPYITTKNNLEEIINKLGRLTLAPDDELYTATEHGVNYGEVGFPTRLHLNNFKFIGILKKNIIKHLDVKSNSIWR